MHRPSGQEPVVAVANGTHEQVCIKQLVACRIKVCAVARAAPPFRPHCERRAGILYTGIAKDFRARLLDAGETFHEVMLLQAYDERDHCSTNIIRTNKEIGNVRCSYIEVGVV